MRKPRRFVTHLIAVLALLSAQGQSARAQDDPPQAGYDSGTPTYGPYGPQHPYEPAPDYAGPNRSGFTLVLTLGFGVQVEDPEDADSDSEAGLSGLNLGLGGFLTPDVALLFRTMGTITFSEVEPGIDATQTSAVVGMVAQFWPIDPLRLEAGLGFGLVHREFTEETGAVRITVSEDESGFGLMLSAAGAFWQNPRHSLQLGIEYAPAFLEETTIHNLGFVFGWQLL